METKLKRVKKIADNKVLDVKPLPSLLNLTNECDLVCSRYVEEFKNILKLYEITDTPIALATLSFLDINEELFKFSKFFGTTLMNYYKINGIVNYNNIMKFILEVYVNVFLKYEFHIYRYLYKYDEILNALDFIIDSFTDYGYDKFDMSSKFPSKKMGLTKDLEEALANKFERLISTLTNSVDKPYIRKLIKNGYNVYLPMKVNNLDDLLTNKSFYTVDILVAINKRSIK